MRTIYSRILAKSDTNSKEFNRAMVESELTIIHTDDVNPSLINYSPFLFDLTFRYESFRDHQYQRIAFPESIVYLELDTNCIPGLFIFPERLESLSLAGIFNQDIKNSDFPRNLSYLALGDNFNQDIKDAHLPDSIISLSLGNSFNRSVRNANFPLGLVVLNLGSGFQRSIRNANFPEGLEEIILSENYQGEIENGDYPESLRTITIGNEVINMQREQELDNQRFLRGRHHN